MGVRHAGLGLRSLSFIVALVVLAGCGSDDSSSDGSTTTTTPDTTTSTSPDVTDSPTLAAIESAQWGENVTVSYEGDTVTVTSDGVPNHARQAQYLVPISGVMVPTGPDEAEVVDDPTVSYDLSFTLTLSPLYSDETTATPLGTIGVIISGAALFNPYEADNATTALDGNFEEDGVKFVDTCSGHPTPTGTYHYHGVPYCITDTLDEAGKHSFVIGLALDGFAIYGPLGDGGNAPTDLDECNGHVSTTPDSEEPVYHYHLTTTAPYSLVCLHGVVDESSFPLHDHVGLGHPGRG